MINDGSNQLSIIIIITQEDILRNIIRMNVNRFNN